MRARVWREVIILPTINYLIYSIGVGVSIGLNLVESLEFIVYRKFKKRWRWPFE